MKRMPPEPRRIEVGLTRAGVARRIGVSRQFVMLLSKGRRRPSLETARRIADVLGLAVAELFPGLEARARVKAALWIVTQRQRIPLGGPR